VQLKSESIENGVSPTSQVEIAVPGDQGEIVAEVEALRRRGTLTTAGRMELHLAEAGEIPTVLREIGRQREISFRAVGEGTGKALDLDRFDPLYLHLFMWDPKRQQIAGAYRIGRTDVLLPEHGPEGLYTSTLFSFQQPFLDHLTPGLELGRSFVTPDYQRSIGALSGLWKGLGHYVTQNPQYRKLFGPVSISRDYTPISRNLIVSFLRESREDADLAPLVHPLHPPELSEFEHHHISPHLDSIEQVSTRVSEVEPDGKGMPVLLRQYLRLNATLLAFNIDPAFGNCLDALLMLDLDRVPPALLRRYLA